MTVISTETTSAADRVVDRVLATVAQTLTTMDVGRAHVILTAAVLASRFELTPAECAQMAVTDFWGAVTGPAQAEAAHLLVTAMDGGA